VPPVPGERFSEKGKPVFLVGDMFRSSVPIELA